ncbi:extracellular solute-binding protein [Peptoniphilus catoniae]|uniref:extracellular solute-binding protein n=1 Tax=Peptoniphilus catoniae TaxID=1660341 RepID=UPI0015D64EC3|nr:extracellular solute-binding protein [Peptoniphilus catoniae]
MKLINLGKKIAVGALVGTMLFSLTACGGNKTTETTNEGKTNTATTEETKNTAEEPAKEATTGAIDVISREQGSGTRGAFTEIVGLVEKNASGEEEDKTSPEATVQNSTNAVMTAVANDTASVGYISLGSLNDTVKAVKVEGVEASADNIKSGEYKIARPFNIVYKSDLPKEAQDFLDFIMSDEGQEIATAEGYVGDPQGKTYEPSGNSAHITISGSTSVTPLMEKLVAAYQVHNPDFQADIQATGSSAGIKDAQSGAAVLGMASRELKDTETGIEKTVIAMDGIAVIVSKDSTVEDLTIEQIKNIFNGTTTDWSEVQ